MTSLNTQLWELISNHKMPATSCGQTFSKQLMDEHGLTRETANVAIEEYRKFMYLCATREARNVPSKAVDLVWHLHMQHSRDYWEVFCKILGKPVHHSPGGKGAGHLADYKATVAAYKPLFGTPPKGVWRQHNRIIHIFSMLMWGAFVTFFAYVFVQDGKAHFVFLLFLALFMQAFYDGIKAMTPKGEFALTFETGDPFANDDAGDCGSGCGGCGD